MTTSIHLLGRPHIERSSGAVYDFRSRKSWAVLAYLILSDRPPTRTRLASLLFAEADDPLRALRWNLSEIRRGLGDDGTVDGDPVALRLADHVEVDVRVVVHGSWQDAVALDGIGADLLEGMTVRGAAAFESWLLAQQRRIAAASEAILHEAAVGSLSQGAPDDAIRHAVRTVAMNPLDENHQSLLIRLYRITGEHDAAEQQYAAYERLVRTELGVLPGEPVRSALRTVETGDDEAADEASIAAITEAGSAAISAGAISAGVDSLRAAVRLADRGEWNTRRIACRLALGEALIHTLRGFDEEGTAVLHEADEIARTSGDPGAMAVARAELGYVAFLRARYDRAEVWLRDALERSGGSGTLAAKALMYLGSVDSDRADYPNAIDLLERAIALAHADPRRAAYATAMLGRVHLLRGEPGPAVEQLDRSIELSERDHWLSFLPYPQALRGEVQMLGGDVDGADERLRQAFARACQLGDPCWEGMAARGLALVADARGETTRAFEVLADARTRCNRLADPYVWLDGYILDAQCVLGRRHDHPDTERWVDTLRELASRTGMRELIVRALVHGSAFGRVGDAQAAMLLADQIDNPALAEVLAGIETADRTSRPIDPITR